MKVCLVLALALLSFAASAQNRFQTVVREDVKAAVSDPSLASYYPKLLARFAAFDTTLTADDYRNLYYGFVFQPSYSGYNDHKKKEVYKLIGSKNYVAAAATCDSVLAELPISLNANFLKGYSLFKADENHPEQAKYLIRYRKLREAILGSGNGLSCETAFKTIFVADEYDIMYNYLDIDEHKGQSLRGSCDVFRIKPAKSFQASELYFDTSETLLSLRNQLNGKR